VSDPKTEVSITEARSYNVNAAVGDTLKQGAVGILVGTTNQKIIKDRLSILTAIPSSFGKVKQVVTYTFSGIGGWLSGGKDPGLAGPIGIAQVTGEVAKVGMFPIFELTALISISLAIVNVLPIPALDGGRLTFVLIEGIRKGKRIPPHLEGKIHMTGFAVLIGLILLMSYFDIIRIISGDGFLP
jgi:regulator of sigma E protease